MEAKSIKSRFSLYGYIRVYILFHMGEKCICICNSYKVIYNFSVKPLSFFQKDYTIKSSSSYAKNCDLHSSTWCPHSLSELMIIFRVLEIETIHRRMRIMLVGVYTGSVFVICSITVEWLFCSENEVESFVYYSVSLLITYLY